MKLKTLQLSDLHVGNMLSDPDELIAEICTTLASQEVELIIFTGDIVDRNSTAPADYENNLRIAASFFKNLLKALSENQSQSLTEHDILFIPGNHEINRVNADFEDYKKFLNFFYNDQIPDYYNLEHFCVVKEYPKQKIVFAGFNSAHYDINKKKDYGYISPQQIQCVIKKLKAIKMIEEYNLSVFLHHHFYLIEERYKEHTDESVLKNSEKFLGNLKKYNLSLIMHGHKHQNLDKRLIITNSLTEADKISTVLGCGSLAKKDASYNAFNYIEIFSLEDALDLIYSEFKYESSTFKPAPPIKLPLKNLKYDTCKLLDLLEEETELYKNYNELKKCDTKTPAEDMISVFNKTIGALSETTKQITEDKTNIACILSAMHFRSNYTYGNTGFIEMAKKFIEINIADKDFKNITKEEVFELLGHENLYDMHKKAKKLLENISDLERKRIIFMLIGLFLYELFITLKEKGESFFDSFIKNKCNFGASTDFLNKHIEGNTIEILADEERRALGIQIVCTNAQAHKIMALIIKEFEILLTPFEEYFAKVGFKIYYILPKINKIINKNKIELESYTFGTYLPTLIKLLAGERLYSQTEVFTRELIQNSIDAISLRKKLSPDFDEEGEINIILSEDKGKKIFEIIDNGTGMHKYILERYFTTIGRSFYRSDDFDHLKTKNNISLNPISNFGIGFLSCFLIGKRIEVTTRYIDNDESGDPQSFFLDIPNYDGCFFIENRLRDKPGTRITVYEDTEKKKFDGDKIIEYIRKNIVNIEYELRLKNNLKNDTVTIKKYDFMETIIEDTKENKLLFVLPFTSDGSELSKEFVDMKRFYVDKKYRESLAYGVFLYKKDSELYESQKFKITNSGVLVNQLKNLQSKLSSAVGDYFDIFINFPSNQIELDVSRDEISDQSKFFELVNKNTLSAQIKKLYLSYCETFKAECQKIPYSIVAYMKGKIEIEFAFKENSLCFGVGSTVIKPKDTLNLKQFFSEYDFIIRQSKLISAHDLEYKLNSYTSERLSNLIKEYVFVANEKIREIKLDNFNDLGKEMTAFNITLQGFFNDYDSKFLDWFIVLCFIESAEFFERTSDKKTNFKFIGLNISRIASCFLNMEQLQKGYSIDLIECLKELQSSREKKSKDLYHLLETKDISFYR